MANYLVTGACGFIGSNYVYYHLKTKPQDKIVIFDALNYAGCFETVAPLIDNNQVFFVKGDIGDLKCVTDTLERYEIDCIVNFAAESHVDRSILGPDLFIKTNIEGTYNLLKCALSYFEKRGQGHFHHISTDEVFGSLEESDPPFTEQNPFRPNSPYSASKAASDCLVRAFVHTYGLKATVTNCSNNYGPRQFPEKLIGLALTNLLEGKLVPIYGDGKQKRDWLFVDDHCLAIDLAIEKGQSGETYNIGGRECRTNLEVIENLSLTLDKIFKEHPNFIKQYPLSFAAKDESFVGKTTFVADRPGHDRRYEIDPSFSEKALGFKPQETFASGLYKTVLWYLENEAWWRALQQRRIDFSSTWAKMS